ncbi:MAG: family 10 glycosylhydrolase [Bacteroides sp.]|nr:family 10 glycosylhydrolase [Bacteroides sp.]
MKKIISCWFFSLFGCLLLSANPGITLEAASPDPTLAVRGPEIALTLTDDAHWDPEEAFLALFTGSQAEKPVSKRTDYTAIRVDREMKVSAVVNRTVTPVPVPGFSEVLELDIPAGGFVVIASDADHQTKGLRRFVAENFRIGDVMKLRMNGEICSPADIEKLSAARPRETLELAEDFMVTVSGKTYTVSGTLTHLQKTGNYRLVAVQGEHSYPLRIQGKTRFSGALPLHPGSNYFQLQLQADGCTVDTQPLVVYAQEKNDAEKELVMWVEQFPNARVLTHDQAVADMIAQVKQAGFTAVALDVKGPEGYASYRRNDLSHTPYFTATRNPSKKVEDNGFDLLESIVREAHRAGLRAYASFNFFTEGNITTGDYAVLDQHREWEEIVQRPEDKGKLYPMSGSSRGKAAAEGKLLALAFVNPVNRDVQDFQLLRVEEVLKNYDVDGIILDRCRYDNLYADFSYISRNAFEDYLTMRGKKLDTFPADAFRIDEEGILVKGKHYDEWITFRSGVICEFIDRVRSLVDRYRSARNPNLKMAAYVGSWYEVYYQNGVNWASRDFTYNDLLGFPESQLYGTAYNQTSYLKNLDFLIIGTYFRTAREVNRYLTLGHILTCAEVPLLGGMSLPDLSPEDQGTVFGASLKNASGLMIFDCCYVDWDIFPGQMKRAFSIQKNKK